MLSIPSPWLKPAEMCSFKSISEHPPELCSPSPGGIRIGQCSVESWANCWNQAIVGRDSLPSAWPFLQVWNESCSFWINMCLWQTAGGCWWVLAQLNEVIDYYESLIENVDVMSYGCFATETLFCLCQCIVSQLGKICIRSCSIWDIATHSKSERRTPFCTQIHHQAELEQVKEKHVFKIPFWSTIN